MICYVCGKRKGKLYGSDIYERTAGVKTDIVNGTADGAFYDGEFTLQYCGQLLHRQDQRRCHDALSLVYPVQNLVNAVMIGFGIGINDGSSHFTWELRIKEMARQGSNTGNAARNHSRNRFYDSGNCRNETVFTDVYGKCTDRGLWCAFIQELHFLFATALSWQLVFEKTFQAVGRMVESMTCMMSGAVINIILDPVMIFGLGPFPKMGIEGAALATGIGQAAAALLYLILYIANPLPVKYRKNYLKVDLRLWKKLYVIGIPASLNLALPSLLISVLNVILTGYGEVYVFVLGVYYKLQTFLYLPANGIVQGMRPLLGYNYGAGEHKRVHKIFRDGLILVLVMMTVGTVICLAVPGQLMGLFTANPVTMQAGSVALRVISLGFIASSVSVICSGALEGLGKRRAFTDHFVMQICGCDHSGGIHCERFMGAVGVWHAFWITEAVTAVISYMVYRKGVKG